MATRHYHEPPCGWYVVRRIGGGPHMVKKTCNPHIKGQVSGPYDTKKKARHVAEVLF